MLYEVITGLYELPIELAYEKTYVNYYNYAQNTDWLKEVTQNPLNPEYNFSLRGGGDKAKYFITMNYNKERNNFV